PGERFVIRGSAAGLAEGRVTTLGGGRVLDVTGIKLRRNRPWTTRRLTRRAEVLDDPAAWAAQVLAEASTPLDAGRLAELAWLKAEVAAELLDAMRIKGQAIPAGSGRFVHRRRLDELAAAIGEQLERFCRDNPLRMGLSADQLAERTDQPQEMVQLAIEKLTGDGKAHLTRGLARPAQMPQALDVEQIQLSETLADAFALAGLQPPGLPELAETFDLPVEKLQPIVELLCDQGLLVDLGKGIYMHRDAVGQGRQQVLALFGRSRWFTTMDFRDALGVSRKYAVPLLDHLDATRWTVRTSNRRSPGHEARKHLDG
ncbi:MAG: SelB C-terminal domain-containing protein, partial [Planctomycetota bacterium]